MLDTERIKNKELEQQLKEAMSMADKEIDRINRERETLKNKINDLVVAEWKTDIRKDDKKRIEENMPIYKKIDESILKELFNPFEIWYFNIDYRGKHIDNRGFVYVSVKFNRGGRYLDIRYI